MSYIFISYSHQDKAFVRRLADTLQSNGLEVWIDDRIDYGGKWPLVIQEKLDQCGAFIVVMSPRSYESVWVQNELSRAMAKKKWIFPLLLEGDIWLSVQSLQCLDIQGGKLPPASFYNRLRQVIQPDQAPTKHIQIPTPPSESRLPYETCSKLSDFTDAINQRWKENDGVVAAAYGGGTWVGAFSPRVSNSSWVTRSRLKEFTATIEEKWKNNEGLSALAYGEGMWLGVFSRDVHNSSWASRSSLKGLTDSIEGKWKDNEGLSAVAFGEGTWLGIFSDKVYNSSWISRSNLKGLTDAIEEKWKDSEGLLALAFGKETWLSVFSNKIYNTSWVSRTSSNGLTDAIEEKWRDNESPLALAYGENAWLSIFTQ